MFASERRKAIKSALYQQKKIDVSQLSKSLNVSEVTIRKDLEQLENEGLLIRTHGGAVLKEGPFLFPPEESEKSLQQINSISRIIACLVSDGDMVFLGNGLLCVSVAKAMTTRKFITVVTNNLSAALVLTENPGIRVICTQGTVYREQDVCSVKGTESYQYLLSLNYDKIILGVDSFQMDRGFSIQDGELARLYKDMQSHATTRIVAAPSQYCSRNALYSIGDHSYATTFVSDEHLPEDYIQFFYNHDIKVYTTYDLEKL